MSGGEVITPGRPLTVDLMSPERLTLFRAAKLCEAGHCFANAALAVLNTDLADEYVLCFLSDRGGEPYGHAVVKSGDRYLDPTLQGNRAGGLADLRYWFGKAYTVAELRAAVKASGQTACPPAIRRDGQIVFAELPPEPAV